MTTVGRLSKDGNLLITGEINERSPSIKNGLVVHYPFDGTDENYVNESDEILIEFGGSIGIPYGRDQYTRMGHIIVLGTDGIDYGLNANGATWSASSTYDTLAASNIGLDVQKVEGNTFHHHNSTGAKWYKCTFQNPIKIQSTQPQTGSGNDKYNRDDFPQNVKISFMLRGTLVGTKYYTLSHPTGNPLIGESMDIVKSSSPPVVNTNTTMTYEGISVEEGTTNIWSGGLNIYNNYGMPASLTDTGEKMFGQPVYRLAMTPTTQAHLDGIRTELGSHGVVVSGQTFLANTKYASSIYWRPVNKQDVVFGGTASNVGWWGAGPTEYLDNGWRRYYQYRDGSNPSDASDSIFQSFYCPSLQLNETIYIDVCCPQTEQGKSFPTAYTSGSRGIGKLYYPISFSQNTNFTINIKVKYNRNDYIMDLFCDDTNRWNGQLRCVDGGTYGMGAYGIELLLRDLSAVNSNNYGSLSFNPNDGNYHNYTLVSINGYGTKVYADGNLVIDLPNKYVNYTSLSIGRNGMGDANVMGGTYKDLSIYDRSLTESEIKKLAKQSFSITKDGDLIAPRLVEKPNGMPSDVIHIPLDSNGKDRLNLLSPSSEANTVYEDGSVWVGSAVTNLLFNSGAINLSTGNDFWNNLTKIDLGDGYYKFVSNGNSNYGNGGVVRLYCNLSDLVNGSSYTTQLQFLNNTGSIELDWCDVYLGNMAYSNKNNGIVYGTNSRATYDDTYKFVDINIATKLNNIILFNPQVTSKPFISPFVNGTRGDSSLAYNLNRDYQLDWSKDWSIVYWKKPVGTYVNTLAGHNLESLGCNSNSVGGGYVFWGKNNNNDTVGIVNINAGSIDPSKYFNNWRMVSLVKTGTTIVSKEFDTFGNIYTSSTGTTDTISNYYVTQFGYDLKLGGWDNTNPCNSYYKDLIIAKRALSLTELESLYKTHMRAYKDKFQVKGNISEGIVL